MRRGMDISNYTQPLTQAQIDYVGANMDFVCIGLQDAAKARAFKKQLQEVAAVSVDLMYYIERPGRDLTIPDPGSIVWVDIEEGCFVERNETLQALADVAAAGFQPYVYGNKYSIEPVFGQSTELSGYPLVHAEYPRDGHVPDMAEFSPYNGWDKPAIWQYSSGGVAGINADLCVSYEEWPVERKWLYGNEQAGCEVRDKQLIYWHLGVEIDAVGDEEGDFPGEHWHHEGDMPDGKPVWVKELP